MAKVYLRGDVTEWAALKPGALFYAMLDHKWRLGVKAEGKLEK